MRIASLLNERGISEMHSHLSDDQMFKFVSRQVREENEKGLSNIFGQPLFYFLIKYLICLNPRS